jgi:hypothetical protein
MNVLAGEIGIESLHDRVVSLVAERWARTVQWTITITTDAERGRLPAEAGAEPDVVVWRADSGKRIVEWIAEVKSEESLSASRANRRWQDGAVLGVPFYLFVPKGRRAAARRLALGAGVTFNGIYEYVLDGNDLRIW